MAYFHFESLLKKYRSGFRLRTRTEGGYNELGDYQPGALTETACFGAVIGLSEHKVYRSEGKLTTRDKRLFMMSPIPGALASAEVIFQGDRYSIEEEKGKDNATFTGVYTYLLRFVSAFNEKGES